MICSCAQMNDSKIECEALELAVLDPKCNLKITGTGYTVKGFALFAGPILTGRINFVSGCYDTHASGNLMQ